MDYIVSQGFFLVRFLVFITPLLNICMLSVPVFSVAYQYIEILAAVLCFVLTSDITYLKPRPFQNDHLFFPPF